VHSLTSQTCTWSLTVASFGNRKHQTPTNRKHQTPVKDGIARQCGERSRETFLAVLVLQLMSVRSCCPGLDTQWCC
jgi:transposase